MTKSLKAMVTVAGFSEISEMHTPAHTSMYNLVFFAVCCIFLQHYEINMGGKKDVMSKKLLPYHSLSFMKLLAHFQSQKKLHLALPAQKV